MKNKKHNWETTLGALIAASAQILPLFGVEITNDIQKALFTVGIFIVGLFANYNK